MATRKHWVAAAASLSLLSLAQAAGVQISQIVNRPPELVVYLTGAPRPPVREAAAALDAINLPVKAIEPWNPATGLALVLAVDVSASMRTANFPEVQRSIGEVLASLPPASKVAVTTFGDEVRVLLGFGSAAAADEVVKALSPDAKQTALYEGLLAAHGIAAAGDLKLPDRRAVLLVTDALDESERGFGPEELRDKVVRSNAPVFVLAMTPQRMDRQQTEMIRALARVARASGGNLTQARPTAVSQGLQALMAHAMQADQLRLDCGMCRNESGMARVLEVGLKQVGATVSDSREIKLPPPPPSPPPPPPKKEARNVKPQTEHPLLKRWLEILLGLLTAGGAGTAYVKRERLSVVYVKIRHLVRKGLSGTGTGTGTGTGGTKGPNPPPPPDNNVQRLTIDLAGIGRQQLKVGSSDLVIGRSGRADLRVEKDPEVSTRHAALYRDKGVLTLRDLGSSNATFLNGTAIVRPEPVHDRDLIVVGRTELRVYFGWV
jgi:Mg-chelatase subunit ChlD